MADLPVDRIKSSEAPISRVGTDFFRPFEVKRGRNTVKKYGVVLTCLAIHAVHIALVHSLDTDSRINALRRSITRRGKLEMVVADNGTNLVGVKHEMRNQIQNWNSRKIHEVLLQKGITWKFNSPTGSHFRGVWEIIIRSIRKVLFSLLHERNVRLDDESVQTLFCEVEEILNCRHLTG